MDFLAVLALVVGLSLDIAWLAAMLLWGEEVYVFARGFTRLTWFVGFPLMVAGSVYAVVRW